MNRSTAIAVSITAVIALVFGFALGRTSAPEPVQDTTTVTRTTTYNVLTCSFIKKYKRGKDPVFNILGAKSWRMSFTLPRDVPISLDGEWVHSYEEALTAFKTGKRTQVKAIYRGTPDPETDQVPLVELRITSPKKNGPASDCS